ncbi:lipoxygenase homology domain-containing protein 1-like [Watersipora subatra]|uniref:lipoxygenase homology domain-containing protein 1-like n=1 Tax=Watersipora subatra TaxID=2589382 RepID=UPI00355C8431
MPETKPRFVPKTETTHNTTRVKDVEFLYQGTGVSAETRMTSVGPVNPQIYGAGLQKFCQLNKDDVKESRLRVKADSLSSQLEYLKHKELDTSGYSDDTESISSDTSSRWQCRETRIKDTGSLDKAKRDYFLLDYIDDRTEMGSTEPINGYCYLCTTQEEHRAHMKSEKKVHGTQLKRYENPVKPETLPSRPFIGCKTESHENIKSSARYKVVVRTGNQPNCGTDAQVTLTMYSVSPKRKTPKMVLKKPSAKFTFMRDSTNTFSVTAENLSEISSIVIETDGFAESQSWFLESVNITNMKTGKSYYFPCSDWLSLYHKGETLARKLTPAENKEVSREYQVTVVTGADKHSGTDSKVFLTLVGSTGHRSKKFLLSKQGENYFRRGAVDTFPLTAKDIGPLAKIRIEHNDKGKSRRWLLLIVHIRDLFNGREHLFYCNQWLVNEEGNAVWREIPSSKVPKNFDLGSWGGGKNEDDGEVLYEINVHTGNVPFAGTDANVKIQLYGDRCHSKAINLSEIRGNYENSFEKNQTDIFQLKAANVGELKKIKIGHDNKGVAAGWYLEKVLVRKFLDVRTTVTSGEVAKEAKKMDEKKQKRKKKDIDTDTSSEENTSETDDSDQDLSDEDGDLSGSATDLSHKSELEKRKKDKQDKRRRRMDNLSDVAEISELSSTDTSLWDSEEMPAMDKGIEAALRLKERHDKLANRMEKIIPMVEEYLFVCKQWFAESEGDGKIERILHSPKKEVYRRR